jgi:bifunctional ADP-heptose synthase (sugar kinase/adenylyltransferase)
VARALADQVGVALADGVDALLVSDYGLGCAAEPVRSLIERRRAELPLFVVDAHALAPWSAAAARRRHPERRRGRRAARRARPGRPPGGWAEDRHHRLVDAAGGADVLVTLDVDGVLRLPADRASDPHRVKAAVHGAARWCNGAGDVFAAAWTAARCVGAEHGVALTVAQAAADVVVLRADATVCGTAALTAHLAHGDPGRVLNHHDLLAVLAEHRAAGHRVVFTNGASTSCTAATSPTCGRPARWATCWWSR